MFPYDEEDINGSEVEWTMGAAMSLLHPSAVRAGRVDDNAVEGCGAIHAVAANGSVRRNKRVSVRLVGGPNRGGGGGGGAAVNGVVALVLVAVVLFVCLCGAGFGSSPSVGKGGPGQHQRWPTLSLVGKESIIPIPAHKRP